MYNRVGALVGPVLWFLSGRRVALTQDIVGVAFGPRKGGVWRCHLLTLRPLTYTAYGVPRTVPGSRLGGRYLH